jgi:hypothetical protein
VGPKSRLKNPAFVLALQLETSCGTTASPFAGKDTDPPCKTAAWRDINSDMWEN